MIARIFLTLLLLSTPALQALPGDGLMQWLGVSKPENPPTVKILMGQEIEGVMISVTGGYNLFNPADGRRLGTRFAGKSHFMKPTAKGLTWGEEFPDLYQLMIIPDSGESTVLVDGTQYKGILYVYQVAGKIFLVNETEVEDYLASTLSSKFPQSLSPEAMNAVAIAARTQVAYAVENSKSKYWNVRAEEVGYNGYVVGTGLPHVQQALEETQGMIMLKRDYNGRSQPFVAEWTAHCAGQTVPYHVMYREGANTPEAGTHSVFAHQDRETRSWQIKMTKQELAQKLGVSGLTSMKVYADKESNKVYAVRLDLGSRAVDMDFKSLQQHLGSHQLRSSDFSIAIEGNEVTFSGVGEGSGVGLCLYSAVEMARRGQNARQILTKFFPQTTFDFWKGPEGNPYKELAEQSTKRPRRGRRV